MRGKRWLAGLTALLLLLCGASALAEQASYVAPSLPSDADPYDPEHPENLSPDQLYAKAAIVVEAGSGEVVFEKNADEIMYPASTTKILTCLLGLMMGDLNATVTMDEVALNVPSDSTTTKLQVGESINFLDLLYATMLRSGNDGANLIAETVSGNINDFVDLMNQAAAMYGCTSTHFMNPTGLHDDNHYTTARDMAAIACAAMQNETFRQIVKTYAYNLKASNLQRSRVLVSGSDAILNPIESNEFYYPYAIGVKTGNTDKAGPCFVGAAVKDGVELISVVFYTTQDGRWTDTKKLMEYGFSQFVSVSPAELYMMNPTTVETSGYSLDDPELGRLALSLRAVEDQRAVTIVATKTDVEAMARDLKQSVLIEYTRPNFNAPITAGESFGTLTYYPADGLGAIQYELVASRSIVRRENAPKTLEEIEAETYADPNPFPPLSAETAVLLGLLPLGGLVLLMRLLMRVYGKTGKHRKGRVPKPGNRYFR